MKKIILALIAVFSLFLGSCYYGPLHPHYRPMRDNYSHHDHHWHNNHDGDRDRVRYHD